MGFNDDVMSTSHMSSSTSISMDFSVDGYVACDRNIENINIEMKPIDSPKKHNNTTYLICTITMGYTCCPRMVSSDPSGTCPDQQPATKILKTLISK
jgi:hypothetical protein